MIKRDHRYGFVDLETGEILEERHAPKPERVGGMWLRIFQDGKSRTIYPGLSCATCRR